MKHILDTSFRYRPSFDTNVRKTFERIRREQQKAAPTAPRVVHIGKSTAPIALKAKSAGSL